MADEKGPGSPLPVSALILALAALGIWGLPKAPLKSDRPALTRLHKADPREEVRARLWEDPFEAVLKEVQEKEFPRNPEPKVEIPNDLKEEIPKGGATILGVMTNGGPYAEDGEWRLRYRYAVVSALLRAGYRPWDERHIGNFYYNYSPRTLRDKENSFPVTLYHCALGIPASVAHPLLEFVYSFPGGLRPVSASSDATQWLEDPRESVAPSMSCIVPYEFFWKPKTGQEGKDVVLLVWINDHACLQNEHPLTRIKEVIGRADQFPEGKEEDTPRIKIIGPVGSTPMVKILRGLAKESDFKKHVQFFCPTATATSQDLLEWSNIGCELETEFLSSQELLTKFKEHKIDFHRTILTDDALARALVQEIDLRVHLRRGRTVDVALVGEKDTIYSRSLIKSFIKAFENVSDGTAHQDTSYGSASRDSSNSKVPKFRTKSFSYLRGLDGKLPGKARNEKTEVGTKAETSDKEESREDRPVGCSRFDYLERLAERVALYEKDVKARHNSAGVLAIGILGSDVYDKLLVIQALRQRFPQKLFFTTDMDARLLYGDYRRWTRNTIVVSSFGLSLNPYIQGSVPPFRDSYQTSLFFTSLVALGAVGIEKGCLIHVDDSDEGGTKYTAGRPPKLEEPCRDIACSYAKNALSALRPRIFEIGTTRAVDLSPDTELAFQPVAGEVISIYPSDGGSSRILYDLVRKHGVPLLLFTFILVCALSYQTQNTLYRLGNKHKCCLLAVVPGRCSSFRAGSSPESGSQQPGRRADLVY